VYTAINFVAWRNFNAQSGVTFDTCTFAECHSITLNAETYTNCTFDRPSTSESEIFISGSRADADNITNATFIMETGTPTGGGHAIELTGSAGAITATNLTFTDWGKSPTNGNGMPFNTTDDVASDQITYVAHGWVTGDRIHYSKYDPNDGTLGTQVLSSLLTDGEIRYVRRVDDDTIELFWTRTGAVNNFSTHKLALSAGGNEVHTLYDCNAALVNNTGGGVTWTVSGGTIPTIRNIGAATTTIVTSPVITLLTVNDENDAALASAQVLMEAGSGAADLPFEATVTITAVTTTATVDHTAHGLLTGDKVAIRYAAELEYDGVFVITVTDVDTYTYTMSGSPSSPATIATGRAAITSTGVIAAGLTNGSGQVTATRAFSVDQPLRGVVRKEGYKAFPISGYFSDTVDSVAGLTKSIQMTPE
jgi:hypothetical protein